MAHELRNQRETYFDVLRIIATINVVIYHVAGYGYN